MNKMALSILILRVSPLKQLMHKFSNLVMKSFNPHFTSIAFETQLTRFHHEARVPFNPHFTSIAFETYASVAMPFVM